MSEPNLELPNLTRQQEEAVTANYLASLEPGFLPRPVFDQVARLTVMPTVEVAYVREPQTKTGGPEVYLTQRPPDDPIWANQWHIPGSVIRGSDEVRHEHDYDEAAARATREIGDVEPDGALVPYDVVRRRGLRGSEITPRVVGRLRGNPGDNGGWFDVTKVTKSPPDGGLIESHDRAIEELERRWPSLPHLGKR